TFLIGIKGLSKAIEGISSPEHIYPGDQVQIKQGYLKFIDNTFAHIFSDSIIEFLKSKNGMYITIFVIVFFILY
ncbi:MAG: hypothetical protein CMG25_06265, partial [Candidatus Marinimicrobia bacterium]|nr:hypothetical protein [Candidatus Neomarinimicrobiota bacterium]